MDSSQDYSAELAQGYSTRAKLLGALFAIILSLCLVVGLSIYSMGQLQGTFQRTIEHDFQSAMDSMILRIYNNRVRASIFTALITDDADKRSKLAAQVKSDDKVIRNHYVDLRSRFANDANMMKKLDVVETATTQYLDAAEQEVIPAIETGNSGKAKSMLLGIQADRYKVMRDVCEEIGDVEKKAADDSLSEAGERIKKLNMVFTVIGGIAVCFSFVLGLTINLMLNKLTSAIAKLRDATGVLNTSVSEILASVTETSTGTAQTAAAVSQTASTVEQVRQTSTLATQRAQSVADRAQRSARISEEGKRATDESAQGMRKIKEQIDLISDGMKALNTRTQSISQIISTVDDLAEQSNLLSVNASIEAAKAGERGKGFAVVAQEVKKMADQSKEATAQVRAILSEIQTAAGAATTAMEQGTKAVSDALGQSSHAGQSIDELAQSVQESAEAATEIAISTQQQASGVDQLAMAMEGIRTATHHNLAAIEQVEQSVNRLKDLDNELQSLVVTLTEA
ncbi:MAG TPA: methyl-accepting chemotaxis protein [Candidatus Obscuribacterales bacterium]